MKQLGKYTLCLLMMAMAIASAAADDWPLVRGDSMGTGVAPTPLTDNLQVLWEYRVDDAGFEGTAVIVDGIAYVGDNAGTFHAVRISDGTALWTQKFKDAGFLAAAAMRDGKIYVGDYNGIIRCLSAEDGNKIWESKVDSEVYAGPSFGGERLLVTTEAGSFTAHSLKDGKIEWTFRIDAPLRCSPTVYEGKAILAGCDGKLYTIDTATGKEVGWVEIDGPTGATAALRNGRAYFGTEQGTFYSIDLGADATQPKVQWTYEDPERQQGIRSAAALTDQIAVFGSQSRLVYALDVSNGKVKWTFPVRSRVESSPIIAGNRALLATTRGEVILLDANSGEVKWQYNAGGGFTASPAAVDSRVVLGNTDGTLYCFGPKDKNSDDKN